MKYADTVQEYIDLYNSGYGVTEILVSEKIKEELILYVEENKNKSNDILKIYASWLLEGQYIDKNVEEAASIFILLATKVTKSSISEIKKVKLPCGYKTSFLQHPYDNWQGVDHDWDLCKKFASQGYAGAQCNLGYYYATVEKDYVQATFWFQKSASRGIAEAQFNLGYCYEKGQGVKQDNVQAVYWFQKSAFKDNAYAQFVLGDCYYYGQGVKQDNARAVYWYQKAAEQKHVIAQFNLGYCYEKGLGVNQDYTQALYWYRKAATNGNKKAVEWINKAARQGNAKAQCVLGEFYSLGKSLGHRAVVEEDHAQAFDWYQKAAEQGDARAQYKVGYWYEHGIGIDQNDKKAVYWYQQAAEQDYAFAQRSLAKCYENGYGSIRDYGQALSWYDKAIKNGLFEAQEDYNRVESILQTQKEKNVLSYSLNLKFGERKDVFISWNHNDIDIKNNIVDKLSQLNFNSVWESDGSGHGVLNDVIKDAILDSKAAIIILTENSIKSDWVRQEVEWILKKTEKDPVYEATIKPLLISNSTQDLSKIINEFDDKNIFKKLINNYARSFEVDIHVLKEFVEQAIDKVLKLRYKEKIINSLSSFKISLSSSLSDDNSVSGIIKSMISFENGYVNRMVYKDNKAYENFDLLKTDKPILIYGNGGVGKSLYLRNIIRKSFVEDNIFFYLEGRNIDDITEQNNLLEIIKKYSYDLYYPTYKDYVVATKFEDIFINHNKKYILIDALDEMPNKKLTILMGLIHKFKNKYDNVYFIFTSRNASNRDVLESTFENEIDLFELRSFTNEEIILLYKNLATNLNKDVSELSFINNLQDISEDVKNNPMLISNMIFIYLATNDFLKKRYDIIKKTVDMLIIDIEKRKNLNFKYEEYLINNLLSDLLGNLSMARANGDLRDTVDIFKEFLKDKIKQEHNLDVVAKEIDEYLTRRAIIVNGRVSHEIFSEYFISSCIFKEIYSLVSSNTGKKKIVMNQESFKDFMDDCFSINDYPWTSITANFICKLDYEINAINGNRSMDESNNNYETFDYTLKTSITNGGFSSSSIDVISDLLRRDSFYFNEFINKYYSK